MSLADAGVQRGTYFAAIASDEMCAYMEAAGAICARWCDGASGRNCHMRHLAMTLALTKLKVLYFTSWSEKSVDWVLRLGLIPGV